MLLHVCFKGPSDVFVGCFSSVMVLGGHGIGSSTLGGTGEMPQSSLLCSCFLPESSAALQWLLECKADLIVMLTVFILEVHYSSHSQEDNTVISDQ